MTFTVEICELDTDSKNRRVTVDAPHGASAVRHALDHAARHGYGLGDVWCRAYEGDTIGLRDQPVYEVRS